MLDTTGSDSFKIRRKNSELLKMVNTINVVVLGDFGANLGQTRELQHQDRKPIHFPN